MRINNTNTPAASETIDVTSTESTETKTAKKGTTAKVGTLGAPTKDALDAKPGATSLIAQLEARAEIADASQVGAGTSADALAAFSALEPLLGEPQAGELAGGFQPRGLDEIANWHSPVASQGLSDLLAAGAGALDAQPEQLQLLNHARALTAHLLANPKAAGEAAKAKLPLPVQKVFEAAMPQLIAAIRATLGSPLLPQKKKSGDSFDPNAPPAAHEDLQIPDADMVKLEKTFASAIGDAKGAMVAAPTSNASQPVYQGPSTLSANSTKMPSGDIDAIVEMVMMEAAQEGEKELQDKAQYQETLNQQTEALRQTMSEQKTEEANAKAALQTEYNRRCALPTSDPASIDPKAITFDNYCNTQNVVQTPPATYDDNGLPTNSPTYSISPNITYYPSSQGGATNGSGGVITQAEVDQAKQLGVTPQDWDLIVQRYASDPALQQEFYSVEAFALAPSSADGLGLKLGGNGQDATIVSWLTSHPLTPPKQTGNTGGSNVSPDAQALMTQYGMSQSDAESMLNLWNQLPKNVQQTYGDVSGMCGKAGANIPQGANASTAHDAIVAFLTQQQSVASGNFGSPTYSQLMGDISGLDPANCDPGEWENARDGSAAGINSFEASLAKQLSDLGVNPSLLSGGKGSGSLDDALKTYYQQMAEYAHEVANGKTATPPSTSAITAAINSLPPQARAAAAQYVQLRLQLAQKDEVNMARGGLDSHSNSYDFGDKDPTTNAHQPNFFADAFSPANADGTGDVNHIPFSNGDYMDSGCHGACAGALTDLLNQTPFVTDSGSAGFSSALTAVKANPPPPTFGNTNTTPTSYQPPSDVAAAITKLSTPVDHTVTQPGEQEVNGQEMTINQVDAQVSSLQSKLDSYGDMSQESQLEIQMAQDRSSKFYEMLSNIMKSVNDTQGAIVANMKIG